MKMRFLLITFIFSVRSYDVARGEEQRLMKSADHYRLAWRRIYTCDVHDSNAFCLWLKDGKSFDPTTRGYSYGSGNNNCSFTAHNVSLALSHALGCVGCLNNRNEDNLTEIMSTEDLNGKCKLQRIIESPDYSQIKWLHSYSCGLTNTHRCQWLKDEEVFLPTRYRYNYAAVDDSVCDIRANNVKVEPLHDDNHTVFCIGFIRYNNTRIDADLNESVELNCHSMTTCVWKRNDVVLDIDGTKYSSTQTTSIDCSIRIRSMESIDFGRWACSSRIQEIITSFTLSLRKREDGNELESGDVNSYELLNQRRSSTLLLRKNNGGKIYEILNQSSSSGSSSNSVGVINVYISILTIIIIIAIREILRTF